MSNEGGQIRGVFFDFGGVIADSPFDAFDRYERENGLQSGFIRSLNTTNHNDNAWARLERSELSFDEFCEAFESEATAAGGHIDARRLFAMFSSHSLRPEMVEAVRRCTREFKTALLTNNFVRADSGPLREDYAELMGLFDVVIESSVTGIRKPDPRFYLYACERVEIEPREAVFLDDLGVNLKPARELGMVTIKVEDPSKAIEALESVLGIALR
jgi:putative hydrolase of the HAD superfamily